jgi:hypothetical protein
MLSNFSQGFSWQRATIGAVVLSCAALLYAAAATGCCGPNEAIIRDCVDAGATDSGDAGTGGGSSGAYCN